MTADRARVTDPDGLRAELLAVTAEFAPGLPSALLREWSDPALLFDDEPIGHSHLATVAVGDLDHLGPGRPDLDDLVGALRARGWSASRRDDSREGHVSGTGPGADDERLHLLARQGRDVGTVVLTAWTPVILPGDLIGQPLATLSIGEGVLCPECHGWGACMDCKGTGRDYKPGTYGRCWCWGGARGPGACIDCAGRGRITPDAPDWKREGYRIPARGSADGLRRPPIEGEHPGVISALMELAGRTCACGDFRCFWRLALDTTDGHLVLVCSGSCQSCAALRAHAFRLPLRPRPDS